MEVAEDFKVGIVAAEVVVVSVAEGEAAEEEAVERGIGFAPVQGKSFPFKICFILNFFFAFSVVLSHGIKGFHFAFTSF